MKHRIIIASLLAACMLIALCACAAAPLSGRYVIVGVSNDPDGTTFAALDKMYKEMELNIADYLYFEFTGNEYKLVLFGEKEAGGVFTRKGNTLTLADDGESTTATVSGGRITWTYENGARLVFRKK